MRLLIGQSHSLSFLMQVFLLSNLDHGNSFLLYCGLESNVLNNPTHENKININDGSICRVFREP